MTESAPQRRSANQEVADVLRETAAVLKQQQANPFRINAYRRAADTVESLDEDIRTLALEKGEAGLIELPGIGRGIAATIREIIRTGHSSKLERLRGALDPEDLLQTIPTIGPELARQIHEWLHVDTLEALETAALDGRLETVPGVGPRRAQSIRASLAGLLGRRSQRLTPRRSPSVATLLDVDAEYRRRAAAGELPKIAPRRFNPDGRRWLAILHCERNEWHFTVLFSNTATAHQLKRTGDWVVIFYYDGDHQEGQHTVVTETRGALSGERVVRGREPECQDYYQA